MRLDRTAPAFIAGLVALCIALLAVEGGHPARTTAQDSGANPPAISEAQAIAIAVNRVRPDGDALVVNNPAHRARFDSEGLSFLPKQGGTEWRWTLSEAHAGGHQVALTDAAPRKQSGIVSYDRGALTEQYVLKAGTIEQQFVVSQPLGAGDLVIEGAVSGGEFAHRDSGWRWGDVCLGDVTVLDARKRKLDARMTASATGTTITVSAASLATAVYPILVDPEIGSNDFRISDMGTDGDTLTSCGTPKVAYSATSDRYLVVWSGSDVTVGDEDIYGQVINASTGAEIGTDLQISNEGVGNLNDGLAPDVCWCGTTNEWFVVFEALENNFNREIKGRFVDCAAGTLVGSSPLVLSDMGGTAAVPEDYWANAPRVAYNSTNDLCLVVWRGDDNVGGLVDGENEAFGQFVNASTHAETGNNDFQVSNLAGANGDPTYNVVAGPGVAWNSTNNEWYVVWMCDNNVGGQVDVEFEIYAQRLNGSTGAEIGTDTRISDVGGLGSTVERADEPDVCYNSVDNEYLVLWRADDGATNDEYEVYGQRVNAATGAEVGTNDFAITNIGTAGNTNILPFEPHAAHNPASNLYLVVWWGDDDVSLQDNELESWGQFLNSNGTANGSVIRFSDAGGLNEAVYDTRGTHVAHRSGTADYLVVWYGDDNTVGAMVDDEFEVWGQRYAEPNNAPVITAGSAVGVNQGSTVTGATIATVTDVEDSNGTLTVTATSVPTGITITNITNSNGTITADVSATGAAALGANAVTLQVEDSGTLTDTDTLTVNVSTPANTAPTITAGGPVNVVVGTPQTGVTVATVSDGQDAAGTLTVTATVVPTGITITNITNTGGTITADVSASGAAATGANNVTLRVQDSGSLQDTDTLVVNVSAAANTAPTITAAAALARTAGAGATNSTVATVTDAEDAAGTLSVTVTAAPAGILVTNIVNTGGTITADVEATAAAANGANDVTLQVEDSGNFTDTAILTINVTGGTGGGGGGDGGDDDDEECSTGGGQTWLWLAGLFGLLALSVRRRRA